MVLKDIHVRENINMDNHRTTTTLTNTTPTTTFTTRRGYTFSGTTLFLIAACFVCTLLAVSFIIFNVATCEQQLTPLPDEEVICTTVKKHILKSSSTTDEAKEQTHYERDVRLPRSLKPQKYNISLVPYLLNNNFTFEGEVHIQVIVLEDCHNITMHAIDLNITKNDVSVRHIGRSTATSALQPALAEHARYVPEIDGVELRIRKQYMLESKQFFIIELYDKLIKGGVYEISIRFSGLIQDYLQGFYRSSYQVGNEKR